MNTWLYNIYKSLGAELIFNEDEISHASDLIRSGSTAEDIAIILSAPTEEVQKLYHAIKLIKLTMGN